MRLKPHSTLLVDAGFWLALLEERDPYAAEAQVKADAILAARYVVPWPTLYETLRTRLVRRKDRVRRFEVLLKRPNALLLDDTPYRDDCLENVLLMAHTRGRDLSLVDAVICAVLDDVNIGLDGLVSYNARDFADTCWRRQILLL
jgi:predicted nucleic acid-binding protein